MIKIDRLLRSLLQYVNICKSEGWKVKKMAYESLKSVYYKDTRNFEANYQSRFNQIGAFKTGLYIHPFHRGERVVREKYELFYIPLIEHDILKDTIRKNSKTIRNYNRDLPDLVNEKIFFSQIIEEIKSTNDIEGVQSSKKEIGEAIEHNGEDKNIRFQGIVNMYMKLIKKEYQVIKEVTRIRDIYDDLFSEDISDDEQPDGELFRSKVVYVASGDKHIHQGNPDEESIIRDLNLLVNYMNRKDVPDLLKCVTSHYFFEYIHPFYDGNGRMGRFLMSNYLSRKLDLLTGITISNAVLYNKKKYEEAFADVAMLSNRADLTSFVQTMYELIINGQETIIDSLQEAESKLNNAEMYLELTDLSTNEKKLLYVLIQNYMFDVIEQSVKDMDVRKIYKWSYPKARKILESLESKGFVERTSKSPSIHKITSKVISEIE